MKEIKINVPDNQAELFAAKLCGQFFAFLDTLSYLLFQFTFCSLPPTNNLWPLALIHDTSPFRDVM